MELPNQEKSDERKMKKEYLERKKNLIESKL